MAEADREQRPAGRQQTARSAPAARHLRSPAASGRPARGRRPPGRTRRGRAPARATAAAVTARPSAPQLVGEHPGERVLGVDDQRPAAGQPGTRQRVRCAAGRARTGPGARCGRPAPSRTAGIVGEPARPAGRRRRRRRPRGRARPAPRPPWRASRPPRRPRVEWRTRVAPTGTRSRPSGAISAVRIRIGASRVCRPAGVAADQREHAGVVAAGRVRSCRAITRQAFSIGLPVTVGANIVSRSTSRTSREPRPASRYSVCAQVRHLLEVRPDHLAAVLGDGGHHLQLLVEHHVQLVGLLGVGEEAQQRRPVGPPPAWRNVPLIGFIITRPSSTLTCRSGRGADQRPGAGVHQERPVRAALGAQQPAQRGQRGGQRRRRRTVACEDAVDDEVGALAAADLLGAGPGRRSPRTPRRRCRTRPSRGAHRSVGQRGERLGQRHGPLMSAIAQALQRRAVVDGRRSRARRSAGTGTRASVAGRDAGRQGDVGEPVDGADRRR